MSYLNRQDAGQQLAKALRRFQRDNVVVLALPRGGVVLGAEVARELGTPLGLVLVRKIGHPSNPEYAVGAVAEDERPIYDKGGIATIDKRWLTQAEASARAIIAHRRKYYYGEDLTPPDIAGKTVIIVDDGIATGLTMEAAVLAVRRKRPKRIVVAIPVAASGSVKKIRDIADEVLVLDNPDNFLGAVGAHYRHFEQIDDEEVRKLLREVNDDLQ